MDIKKIQINTNEIQDGNFVSSNNLNNLNRNIKNIYIPPPEPKIKSKSKLDIKTQDKNISYEKEKKFKVETDKWGLNKDDLLYENQCELTKLLLETINSDYDNPTLDILNNTNKLNALRYYKNNIKTKLSSYKQQDIIKKKYNEEEFVSYEEVIRLINDCNLLCHYCNCEVYILYEIVREMKQWSLDRINNDIGHNTGNLLVACLECNLKRRRTNKDAFLFTKNLVITREGLDDSYLL
jgi:hypothetical protein